MHPTDTAECFSSHMGIWACEPLWLRQAVAMVRGGNMPTLDAATVRERQSAQDEYQITKDGVAVIPISGPMAKSAGKFGGTSTVAVRRALRAASTDRAVKAVMLHIESPGGHVSGTQELASEVRRTRDYKPVHAHISDLGASAAYWVASQADTITSNLAAKVGSIGVMTTLVDTSERMEREGVKVHVVRSSPLKASGAPGTPITEDVIASVQELVDHAAHLFVGDIAKSRNVSGEALTGEVFTSTRAQALGLIDRVASFEDALAAIPLGDDDRDRAFARINIERNR